MDVHREETWLQASDLVAAAGQPTLRKMGWRYSEHRGPGRVWPDIHARHRPPMMQLCCVEVLFVLMLSYPYSFEPLSRC